MAWTCLWEGCPDRGFTFRYVIPRPVFRPEGLRLETYDEAHQRDIQRHHQHMHGVHPDRPNTDNRRLSPADTLD